MPVSPFFGVFALTADVRNTVFPTTTGDDQPWPGTSTLHFTFWVFDHVSGNFASSASPFISGPRNPGHDAGGAVNDETTTDDDAARTARINEQRMRRDRTSGVRPGSNQ